MVIEGANVPEQVIVGFCRRWRIRELALFGSVLRDAFDPDSGLDVLVTFAVDATWGLLDHVQLQRELETLLQRNVDPSNRSAVRRSHNWLRREEILGTAQVGYSA